MTLRVSEVYISTQGEGPRTGEPTTFLRFAGCNMRCPGWPCDTEHAINPAIWKKEATKEDPLTLLDRLPEWPRNVCLTGGEPFMQSDVELQEFVMDAMERGHKFEVFTNGSFSFPPWAVSRMLFMMDWKLEGSGEAGTKLPERFSNARKLNHTDGIKFVVTDLADMREAFIVYRNLVERHDVAARFWIAPAWGKIDPTEIVEFVIDNKLPWSLNIQTHKYIWDPDKRGV
jgi:7-carboxy-7-deazaguanine synthase